MVMKDVGTLIFKIFILVEGIEKLFIQIYQLLISYNSNDDNNFILFYLNFSSMITVLIYI